MRRRRASSRRSRNAHAESLVVMAGLSAMVGTAWSERMPVPGRSKATRPGNEEPGSGSLPWQRTHGNIKMRDPKRLSASTSWSSGMQPRNACPDWASHLCPRPEPHGLRRPPTRHSPPRSGRGTKRPAPRLSPSAQGAGRLLPQAAGSTYSVEGDPPWARGNPRAGRCGGSVPTETIKMCAIPLCPRVRAGSLERCAQTWRQPSRD